MACTTGEVIIQNISKILPNKPYPLERVVDAMEINFEVSNKL